MCHKWKLWTCYILLFVSVSDVSEAGSDVKMIIKIALMIHCSFSFMALEVIRFSTENEESLLAEKDSGKP